MFFLWFAKNKHFKQGRNLSGQIMPFLLVIIALFLGAFFTTYQIGSNAINATCSDNAADACSLAAASHMAYNLNLIHKSNGYGKDLQGTLFNKFQAGIKNGSKAMRNVLVITKHTIAQAKAKLNTAKASAAPGAFCTVWYSADTASHDLTRAADLVQSAMDSLVIASGLAVDLGTTAEDFKKKSHNNFCSTLNDKNVGVNALRDAAKKDGISYALMNNCVFPTLSSADQTKIGNQINGAPQDNNNPSAGLNYKWGDSAGNNHSMSANVTLPQIASYELEVTKMNESCGPQNMPRSLSTGAKDPYGIAGYTALGVMFEPIAGKLRDSSTKEETIYAATKTATSPPCPSCTTSCATGYCCPPDFIALDGQANVVIAQIDAALNDLDTATAAIDSLIQFSKDIVKDLGPKPGKRIVSSHGCGDSGNVIIIALDDIKFKSGCIKCSVNMSNAGIPSASGTSTSSFGGGSLRASQPNQHYVPNVTGNSCPNHGGLTTGSTTNFSHSDGGCN